jgi:hypothetical protein
MPADSYIGAAAGGCKGGARKTGPSSWFGAMEAPDRMARLDDKSASFAEVCWICDVKAEAFSTGTISFKGGSMTVRQG